MKYIISKADGSPVDETAVYYVLRLDKDTDLGVIARGAIMAYAKAALFHDRDVALSAVDTLKKAVNMIDARKITEEIQKMAFPKETKGEGL